MPNVFIARHGETTWNVAGRYQGRLESELSPLGVEQARRLAEAMKAYDLQRVLSSPLKRCVATAQPSAAEFGLQVEAEPLLVEIAHGTWEGRLRDELERNDAERYRRWRHEPHTVSFEDGESVADVLARWRTFVSAFEPQGDCLIVTHDAVVRVALVERLQRNLDAFWQSNVSNGAYAWFSVERGRWRLQSECVTAHLAHNIADTSSQAL